MRSHRAIYYAVAAAELVGWFSVGSLAGAALAFARQGDDYSNLALAAIACAGMALACLGGRTVLRADYERALCTRVPLARRA